MLSTNTTITFVASTSAKDQEKELIAVIQSGSASRKEKADACRNLGRIGGIDSVAPLAALLTNEELSHMARYGLEPNPDPSVDEALRAALGKVKGRLLTGVIGSLGVRKDAKAIKPIAAFLKDSDPLVVSAAARALGSIGRPAGAKALDAALDGASKAGKLAICEGLFRCAESLTAKGKKGAAQKIYNRLNALDIAHQVKTGAQLGL